MSTKKEKALRAGTEALHQLRDYWSQRRNDQKALQDLVKTLVAAEEPACKRLNARVCVRLTLYVQWSCAIWHFCT
jgi:hypothetical protein